MTLRNGSQCRKALARFVSSALLAAALGGAAQAQTLAAPERIPANPTAVLSIPDTQALWAGLADAPITKAVSEAVAAPHVKESDNWLRFVTQSDQLQKSIGVALWPSELLGKHLVGVDIYVVENADKSLGMATVVKCVDPETPQRVLDHIKQEATTAKGVAGGYTAETVVEKTISGKRALILPAFSLALVADGPLLTWATSETVLVSSMEGKGAAYLNSEAFQAEMQGLSDEKGEIWMQGDLARLAPILRGAGASLKQLTAQHGAAKISVAKDAIKISTFAPLTAMEGLDKRYALAAPAPGDVTVLNFFSSDALMVFGSNYFDGLTLLDKATETLSSIPDSPITGHQVEEQVATSRTTMGFDLRNDLLGNLGPDFGMAVEKVILPGQEGGKPQLAAVVVTKVKNRERFQTVIDHLEAMVAPPPPTPVPNAKGTPAAGPASPLRSESVDGGTLRIFDSPQLEAFGLKPSYLLSDQDYFLFALSPEGVKNAQARFRGGNDSLVQSPLYKQASAKMETTRNSLVLLPTAKVVAALRGNAATLGSSLTPEQKLEMETGLKLLESMQSIAVGTIYKREGKKQEILLGM